MRGKRRIDLRVDPPPDLALEVDVTHRSVDRMAIYARLGVSEVWRSDARGLSFETLQADGHFAGQTHSRTFPLFTPADVTAHLTLRTQDDENNVVRQFRALVRQRTAAVASPAAPLAP